MAILAAAEVTQTSTRHYLDVISEGPPGLPILERGTLVKVEKGALALSSAGSDMGVVVRLERHDTAPPDPPPPWVCAADTTWELTSGQLGVGNLEGMLKWAPDVGLTAGCWHVRVLVAGQAEAADLEEELLERLARYEDFETPLGPERWVVQLWA